MLLTLVALARGLSLGRLPCPPRLARRSRLARPRSHPCRAAEHEPDYPTFVTRIYTRTGDDGTTGLLYGGRVSKADRVPEVLGSIDEIVAALGLARALTAGGPRAGELLEIQRELFVVGADLGTNPAERDKLEPGVSSVTSEMAARLEARIDELVASHPLPNAFVVPGANPVSAALDVARSVTRTAERRVVELREGGARVSDVVLAYVNRLSDLLFVLARIEAGEAEPLSR